MRSLSPESRRACEEYLYRNLQPPPKPLPIESDIPRPVLSLRDFTQLVKPQFQWHRQNIVLNDVLQRVVDGSIRRLMVLMPRRHGKSEQVSRILPAYWLYRFPQEWVALASYGDALARRLSGNARDNYARAGEQIRHDIKSVSHWETLYGGGMWSTGVGGPALGKGWQLGIVDDPIKNAVEAFSDQSIATLREWYDSTWTSCEEPRSDGREGAMVHVYQRFADSDLGGWMFEREIADSDEYDGDPPREHWHVVALEAIKEAEPYPIPPTCTLEPDWRQPGEPLCPERYSLKFLKHRRASNPFFFSAMFQQRPAPKTGGLFDPADFRPVTAIPAGCKFVRYWDKAGAAPGQGDWTVGVLMARAPDGIFYVVHVERFQETPDKRNAIIHDTAVRDRAAYGAIKTYVEQPPGDGVEATGAVIKALAGFNAEADPVRGDKVSRAEPFSAQTKAGNVRMVVAPWNQPYLNVMKVFPFAKKDDDVDASSGAFNRLNDAKSGKFW